jgi:hypothetical protein
MSQAYSADGTRQERTGWRDQEISARHREWGFDCPAVDVDFLAVEYNFGKPVALVEYKRFTAEQPNTKHPTYRALHELAQLAGLPFFISFYWPDIWAFKVCPMNDAAHQYFKQDEMLTEYEYVTRLYRMRRNVLKKQLESVLHRELPR